MPKSVRCIKRFFGFFFVFFFFRFFFFFCFFFIKVELLGNSSLFNDDDDFSVLRAFKHYLSHIGTMEG